MTDLNLKTLLENIRIEAARLQRDGLDIDAAYQQAIVVAIKAAAEAHGISPFEARILSEIDRIAGETRRPVPTHRLCAELGTQYAAAFYHLRNLERRGLLSRPSGPRSGWQVAA